MNGTRLRLAPLVALAACLILLTAAPLQAGPGTFTTAMAGKAFTQVAADPANTRVVYAAGTDASGIPYVYKTFDSGTTWASVGTGLGPMNVFALAINKANDNVVYVGGYNFSSHLIALYQSLNGGASWTQVATNLGDNSVQAIALDPNLP